MGCPKDFFLDILAADIEILQGIPYSVNILHCWYIKIY